MGTKIKYYLSALFLFLNIYGYSQSGIQCVECGGMNGNHKTWCKYYNPPAGSSSSSSPKQSLQQEVLQGALQGVLNNIFAPSTYKQTEQDKLREQQEEQEKNRIAAIRAAKLKRYNDSIQQVQHDNMMKSYKVLDDGVRELTFKGLIDEKPAWDPSVVVLDEQNMIDNNTQTWVEYQREQFKIRLEQPNYWCKKYYNDLVRQDSLIKAKLDSKMAPVPPIKLSEIQPGDVILIGPTDTWISKQQAKVDAALNDNDANFTHTVTCVKVVDGHRLFMDNQANEGTRVIDEKTFVKRYGKRDAEIAQMRGKGDNWGVAQPLNKDEAEKLWSKAKELNKTNDEANQQHSGTNYGTIIDDNVMVCSTSSWMLINATGRYQIAGANNSKLITKAGVRVTPASFENIQQYFLITPLNYNE